jgi:O-antigen ligase
VTTSRRTSVSQRVLVLPLLLSGLVDLPRAVGLGPVSGLAVLSILYTATSWLLWSGLPLVTASLLVVIWPLLLFLTWGFLSMLWHPPTLPGLQNLLVVLAFVGLVLLSARESRRKPHVPRLIEKALVQATRLAAGLYGLGVLLRGLGSDLILAPRAFALFALTGLAWHLACWHYGSRRNLWEAVAISAVIGVSLSRLASMIALLLFPLSQIRLTSIKKWMAVVFLSAAMVGLAYLALTYIEPIRARFFEGDLSLQVGTVAINVMGRANMWRATVDSWKSSPWIGRGPGAAQTLLRSLYPNIFHPHNDYLRVLHDYGIVGLSLWVLGLVNLLRATWGARRRSDRLGLQEARLHWAAFLALVALVLSMVTDNSMAYIFVMAPQGILIGTSLGRRGIATTDSQS